MFLFANLNAPFCQVQQLQIIEGKPEIPGTPSSRKDCRKKYVKKSGKDFLKKWDNRQRDTQADREIAREKTTNII